MQTGTQEDVDGAFAAWAVRKTGHCQDDSHVSYGRRRREFNGYRCEPRP
jgi:hypothetical protein